MKLLKTIDTVLARVLKWMVIAMCVALALILMARVLIRVYPFFPMSWSDEIVEMLMAWMVMTTATLIMRSGDHFRVTLLEDRIKGTRANDLINALIALIGVCFFAVLAVNAQKLVASATQTTPILKMKQGILYASLLVNCVLMLIYLLRDTILNMSRVFRRG